ncbi:ABC transporter substrate-binding protein [Leucobacter allii]|uniref:ABC transporter substrate-binding protein n=1 Tax=Leucobacter allii TaxID=2932247 RepID=UPI001FD12F39|nr:ABC transporter substrate-binding protein [Leucobacter allii]UOR02184.1 ABC transporter substrate-binding protein [Leucobacter allii]
MTGCSATGVAESDGVEGTEPSQTIRNCDTDLAISPTPERVVTIKSTPLELMLALGLEDRVVASAFLDGPLPDELLPSGWEPNVISDDVPGRELLVSQTPDLVFAGWASNLSADGPGTRDALEQLGIRSYVSPAACDFGEAAPEALTFEDDFAMFREVGTIFGAEQRAEELVAEQQRRLEAIERPDRELTALWYSSGDDAPFVGGGTGAPNMIMEAAGLRNVEAESEESWLSLSWESFVAADPDVIVLVDTPWSTAEDKRERIETQPAAQTMRAVVKQRYITVPFDTTEAGVRNVDGVEIVASAAAEFAADAD